MLKRKLVWLLALLSLLTAGCGKGIRTEQTRPPEASVPSEPIATAEAYEKYEGVTLIFSSAWAQDVPEAAVLTQAAELFEATTGAEVEIRWMPERYDEGDILQLPGGVLAENYEAQVLDLTQMAQAAGYEEKSFECLRSQVISRSGTLNAIPQTPYVSGFYYNAEIFDTCGITQMPKSYSAFLELCQTLADEGYSPVTLDSTMAGELLLVHLAQYLGTQAAAEVVENGGWSANPQVLQAVEDIWNFAQAGFLAYGTPAAYPAGQSRMGLSNCGIVYGTNSLCPQVENQTYTSLLWGMFPYPGVDGAEPVISVDADVLAISAACENPQAAFDFVMLLTTGEFDQLRADITNGIPADPSNISPIRGAVKALEVAHTSQQVPVEFSDEMLAMILKLWQGGYENADDFVRAMDELYTSKTETESRPE